MLNNVGKTHLYFRGSGLPGKRLEELRLKVDGDLTRYNDIVSLTQRIAKFEQFHRHHGRDHHYGEHQEYDYDYDDSYDYGSPENYYGGDHDSNYDGNDDYNNGAGYDHED